MTTAAEYWKRAYDALFYPHEDEFRYWAREASRTGPHSPCSLKTPAVREILERVETLYGFALDFDYPLLYAWQSCFGKAEEDEALLASLCVVLYGIFADLVLDSPRFGPSDKSAVCGILRRNATGQPKAGGAAEGFAELDFLWSVPEAYYRMRRAAEAYSVGDLRRDWRDACASEEYMWRSPLLDNVTLRHDELPLLRDKSVKFEKVAFLTATLTSNTAESVHAAETLGRIMWLVDDLCDLVEDVRERRKNSLLVYCAPDPGPAILTERVELVIRNLDRAAQQAEADIAAVREVADDGLYGALMARIWRWSERLRSRI